MSRVVGCSEKIYILFSKNDKFGCIVAVFNRQKTDSHWNPWE